MKYITAYFCAVIFIGDNMEKEIAIIIPAYNAHDTIKNLMYSILAQKKSNFCQVILINDEQSGSYDYLYEDIPELDLVILNTPQTQSGPGKARNIGIKYAINKKIPYIIFSDADDLFYSNLAIEMLYTSITKNNSDFVFGNFYEVVDNSLILHEDYDIWVFAKIYKTDIIKKHQIQFPEITINEDVCFNLHYWLAAENKINIHEILYLWQENFNSITRRDGPNYLLTSYIPLCQNLLNTYEKIEKDILIDKEKIKYSIINRIIRLYYGYNELVNISDERVNLQKMDEFLFILYQKIFNKYWKQITQEEWLKGWNDLKGLEDRIPYISFTDFLKKIRGE